MKFKYGLFPLVLSVIFSISTISSPYTRVFGKYFNKSKDFICCKSNNLILHHYYSINIFWIEVYDGYSDEVIGKSVSNGCAITCNN